MPLAELVAVKAVFIYQCGSGTAFPCASEFPGGMYSLHGCTSAHMLKALAIGPNVPAMRGHAVDANHQRLGRHISPLLYFREDEANLPWVKEVLFFLLLLPLGMGIGIMFEVVGGVLHGPVEAGIVHDCGTPLGTVFNSWFVSNYTKRLNTPTLGP